jgi:4-amino-4-deoxy-L-arabinose transferase-like glycosyltransferase
MRQLSVCAAAVGFVQWVDDVTRRHRLLCWLAFTVVYALGAVGASRMEPLPIDELITLHVSRLPSMSLVWSALAQGADGNPPFFHVVTRIALALFGESELSLRLPSMVAFWFACLFLYLFVTRRYPPLFGWIAVLLIFRTFALFHSIEARPYPLVLAFSSLAMVCWQLAAEGKWRWLSLPGLAGALAAATSCHYYAALVSMPLALGELVRCKNVRKPDFPVWIALSAGLVPLAFYLPLMRGGSIYIGYLTSIGAFEIASNYVRILKDIPFVLIAVLTAYLAEVAFGTEHSSALFPSVEVPRHEVVAAIGFIVLPALTRIAATYTTQAYIPRYSIPVVLGLSVGLAILAHSVSRRYTATIAVLLLLLFGLFAVRVRHVIGQRPETAVRLIQKEVAKYDLPIAVEQGSEFLPLSYYGAPQVMARIRYLANLRESQHYLPGSRVEQGMLALRPWTSLSIEDYESFVSSHKRFYVYSVPPGGGWLISKLTDEKAHIQVEAKDPRSYLFLVTLQR